MKNTPGSIFKPKVWFTTINLIDRPEKSDSRIMPTKAAFTPGKNGA